MSIFFMNKTCYSWVPFPVSLDYTFHTGPVQIITTNGQISQIPKFIIFRITVDMVTYSSQGVWKRTLPGVTHNSMHGDPAVSIKNSQQGVPIIFYLFSGRKLAFVQNFHVADCTGYVSVPVDFIWAKHRLIFPAN